ncbi:hypothetical protein [Pseudomonas viridiflava]|uniref:hypothetical protein n=1 Tax=Pseudomonas viridiflava TaxID=33069 RepID=UPI000F06423A|nr:hypothetical protein [Pseudomonas viridiflava]
MSNNTKESSEQLRASYGKWLRNRTGRKAGVLAEGVLPAPAPNPEFWPGEPDFAAYVPRDRQDDDLQLIIPGWPNGAPDATERDTLSLEWKQATDPLWGTIKSTSIPGPIDPTGFVPEILEKVNFSAPGTYNLRYRVKTWNDEEDSSATINIIIDKSPPNFGGQEPDAPIFKDTSLVTDGITDEYLDTHPNVTMVIPIYDDEQPGDIVEVSIYGREPDPITTPVFSGSINSAREADIPAARIRNLLDGYLYVIYHLVDKVGNIGSPSKSMNTELLVSPLPVPPLAAPKVPLAEDAETLIDLDDVRDPGVEVTVALYTNWLSMDTIEVDWGGFTITYPVGIAPQDPIRIPAPYATLKAAYGAGTTGPKSTVIKYDVRRGSKSFPSAPLTINVDLSVPGPDPVGPDPINPNLKLVTVRGGGTSAADNVLNADDTGLAATAAVEIYEPHATGERMSLYWGSLSAPVAIYDPLDADPVGKIVTFSIPWTEIEKEPGKTDLPVFYSLTYIAGGNSQRSGNQLVDVTGALPIQFATPEFPDAGTTSAGRPILNCSSFIAPDHHVLVEIPGNNPLLVGGEQVVVTWQAYSDLAGTIVAGTPWTDSRTVSPTEARDGYELHVEPYADHIEPVGAYGAVRVTYNATVGGNPVSGSAYIWASSTSAGGTCVLTP